MHATAPPPPVRRAEGAPLPGGRVGARPVPEATIPPYAEDRAARQVPAGAMDRRIRETAEIPGAPHPHAPADTTDQWKEGTPETPGAHLSARPAHDVPPPHAPVAVMDRWTPGLVEERPGREAALSRFGDRARGLREGRTRWRHDPDPTPSRRHATPVP